MSVKVEPGTYQTKTTAATIYEAPSGAVMCRISTELGLTGGICLIQKDGTLSERGFRDAAAILGIGMPWDWALWDRDPEEWAGHDVEAVVETIHGEKGEFSSVKYLNPPGGGRVERCNAKALATKYGAKTRALFGGAPAKPATPPPARPKPPPPAAKHVRPGTMEEAWDAFCKHPLFDGKPEAELYVAWDKFLTEKAGKTRDLTPDDWGSVMDALDQVPF